MPDLDGGQRAPRREDAGERLAPQELHHEVDDAPGAPHPVDRDDVGVFEAGGRPRLPLEPLHELGVERERKRQDLHRHLALELTVARTVHDGHPAAAQLLE